MAHPHLSQIQALPLHQHLGVRVLSSEGGTSRVELTVSEANVNPMRVLHGGVLYAVCDVSAYVALVSVLAPDEAAVTHDIHVSCMRPAALGSNLVFHARVVQKGRALAFIDAEAKVGEKLIATARVTKTIVVNSAG